MKPFRLITSLLLEDERLIKTIQFKKPQYIGEPINAVKIFSSKGVDELLVLDKTQNGINFDLLEQIFGEAFMPVTYGGSIRTMADVDRLFSIGVDKVLIKRLANQPDVIQEISEKYGEQSISVCVNVTRKSKWFAKTAHCNVRDLNAYVEQLSALPIGEIVIQDVDREGTLRGLDFELAEVVDFTSKPIVLSGGFNHFDECRPAMECGLSGVAAGSRFVYNKGIGSVLLNYPFDQLNKLVYG